MKIDVALLGFDGKVVGRTNIDEPLPDRISRPVAAPLSLEQLRRMAPESGGIDEDDDLPPLSLDDERDRLPEITVEEYQRERVPHEMERGVVFYRRVR